MKTWVCKVCGYVHIGETPPEKCPQCGVGAEKFELKQEDANKNYADEHIIGVAQGVDPEIVEGLRADVRTVIWKRMENIFTQ